MPLIHVGFPKTATTWLQKSLFLPKFGFIRGLDHAQIQGGIISPTPFIYNPEIMLHRYDINIERRTNQVPVVSSESLAGNIYCGGYNVKQNADRLHDTFPGGRVLIVTREQKSLIRALYKTLVQWGMPHSIDRLLYPLEPHRFPQFTVDYFRFEQVGGYYMKLFGEDNVLIIPYELLERDPARFTRDIVAFSATPVPFEQIYADITPARRLNTNRPISAIMFQRWFNYFFIANALNYSGLVPSEVGKGMYRVRNRLDFLRLPKFIDERMERRFHRKVEERTDGIFARGNRRLQEMTGYDLGALGYEV